MLVAGLAAAKLYLRNAHSGALGCSQGQLLKGKPSQNIIVPGVSIYITATLR